jgi:ribose transport system permease protein
LTYNVIGIIVAVAVNAALSLMPAKLAKDKGCSFFAYWFLGIFLTFITCYMVVESLEDKRAPLGNWKPANGYSKPVHPGNKDIPGLALTGIFLLGALILCMTDSRFFSAENLRNVADVQFGFYAAAALAVALTMKAGGPDISFVPISVLAGYIAASGDPLWGLVSALGVCVLIGIVNGLIVTLTNMPAVIATLITGALALLSSRLVFGTSLKMTGGADVLNAYLLPVIAAAVCAALVFFTKLRLPKDRHLSSGSGSRKNKALWRKNIAHIAAFSASAAIAALAGYFIAKRLGAARQDSGQELCAVVALVFFAVSSLRLKDSKWSVFYALVPVFGWTLLGNGMNLLNMSSYDQMLVRAIVIIIFSAVFFVSRVKRRSAKKKDQESVV